MIKLRRRTYDSKNSFKRTLDRLNIDVEQVDQIEVSGFGDTTIDTNKRWIGTIEKENGEFEVVKPNTFVLPLRILEGNFYTLYVHGKVFAEGSTCKIKLVFELDGMAFARLMLICLFPLAIGITLLMNKSFEEIKAMLPFVFIFTMPAIVTLIYQLNKTEREIKDSLGVRDN